MSHPAVELLDDAACSIFVAFKTSILFPHWLYQFTFPPTVSQGFRFSTSSNQHLLFVFFLTITILTGVR